MGEKVGGRSGVYFKSKMSTHRALIELFSLEGRSTAAHLQANLIVCICLSQGIRKWDPVHFIIFSKYICCGVWGSASEAKKPKKRWR